MSHTYPYEEFVRAELGTGGHGKLPHVDQVKLLFICPLLEGVVDFSESKHNTSRRGVGNSYLPACSSVVPRFQVVDKGRYRKQQPMDIYRLRPLPTSASSALK